MSQITDKIDKYRRVFREYDAGNLSAASCLHDLEALAIDPFLGAIESGAGYTVFGSCCCSKHPPDRIFTARFHIQAHGFEVKRVSEVQIIPETQES